MTIQKQLPHKWKRINSKESRCIYCHEYWIHDLPSEQYNERMKKEVCTARVEFVQRNGYEKKII